MLVLDTTTDNIQIVLDKAITTNQLQCVSSWRDITTTWYTPWRTVTNTNSTTDVNIVPAPWASTQRVCDNVCIYNNDTVIAQVIVKFDANWTEYILTKVALAPNERLEYSEKKWWRVFSNVWSIKTIITWSSDNNSTSRSAVVTTYDQVNSDATADKLYPIVGMSFNNEKQKTYYFKAIINYTSAATTTGCRTMLDIPLSISSSAWNVIRAMSKNPTSTTAEWIYIWTYAMTNWVPATCAATGANICVIEWFIVGNSPCNMSFWFSSEILSSAVTVKKWSILFYQEVL